MANRKISALTAILSGDISTANDYLPIVDASVVDADKNKRVTVAELGEAILAAGLTTDVSFTGNVTQTGTTAYAYKLARSGGGDKLRLRAEAAGGGGIINAVNSAEDDLEPLNLGGEYVSIDARVSAGATAEIARVTSTGLGVFTTPVVALHVSKADAGNIVAIAVANTSDAANSDARIHIQTGSASAETAGDPYIRFEINNVANWALGVDNDGGDAFKISQSSVLGANDMLLIQTDGIAWFGRAAQTANPLRLVGADATGDNYMSFYRSNGSTRKAYLGFGNSGDDTFQIANEESGGAGGGFQFVSTGNHPYAFAANGGTQFGIGSPASSVNYLQADGGPASTNVALKVAGASASSGINFGTRGSGSMDFYTDYNSSPAQQVKIAHTASAVNYLQVTGASTGNAVSMRAAGSDTDVSMILASQGGGTVWLFTNTGNSGQVAVTHTADSVNYLQLTGGATGNGATLSANGSDSNVDLWLFTKGSGRFSFHTNASGSNEQVRIAHIASAVNYVQLYGNTTGNGPVVEAAGSDSNVRLNLFSKGTGFLVLGNGTADILWNKALVALGGGAAATLGTIGGSGPATAAQNTWMRVVDTSGNAFWVPAWK